MEQFGFSIQNVRLSACSSCRSRVLPLQGMGVQQLCQVAVMAALASTLMVGLGLTTAAAPTGTVSESGSGEPSTTITIMEQPILLHTIKNPQCQLHKRGQSRTCGMRQLDAVKGSGVIFWNPRVCQRLHCQCQAVKDVAREKRSIYNNKTTIEYKRFRIFECL